MSFPVRVEGPQMKTVLDERCVLMQVCFEIGTVKAHRSGQCPSQEGWTGGPAVSSGGKSSEGHWARQKNTLKLQKPELEAHSGNVRTFIWALGCVFEGYLMTDAMGEGGMS